MNSVSKHALLYKVGKCFGENPMVVDTGLLVLHMLVSSAACSDLAKLFSSNSDQHRGEGGTIDKHGFSIGFQGLFSANNF